MFNIQSLTLGEVATVEDLAGTGIGSLGEDQAPKGKMMAALAYVVQRRKEPGFKWNDALGLTMPEAHKILGIDDDEDEGDESDPT